MSWLTTELCLQLAGWPYLQDLMSVVSYWYCHTSPVWDNAWVALSGAADWIKCFNWFSSCQCWSSVIQPTPCTCWVQVNKDTLNTLCYIFVSILTHSRINLFPDQTFSTFCFQSLLVVNHNEEPSRHPEPHRRSAAHVCSCTLIYPLMLLFIRKNAQLLQKHYDLFNYDANGLWETEKRRTYSLIGGKGN